MTAASNRRRTAPAVEASSIEMIIFVLCTAIVHAVDHVHFVDKNINFLFRGGSPDDGYGNFDYSALRSAIDAAAGVAGVTLPKGYVIADIDVMKFEDGSYDGQESLSEFEYFQTNPQDGEFIFWRTTGTNTNATQTTMTSALRTYLVSTYDQWAPDMLIDRANALKQMLATRASNPIVYYLHCDCGCDRTGEVIGAYSLTHLNMTWAQYTVLNQQISGRSQCCPMYRQLQWYCLYLNANGGRLGNCLKSYTCYRC